ncbi:MAG: SMI1/KNR4 family protein [Candidatus Hermodarchaeota archaeon]
MSIIKSLHKDFSIAAYEKGASQNNIEKLKEFSSIEVPKEYIDLVKEATEIEIGVQKKMFIRIWSPEGCIELNEAYNIQLDFPNSLAIGDDEGGKALLYMTGSQGFGLYKSDFGDPFPEDATFLASSLRELLVDGIGIEKLLYDY